MKIVIITIASAALLATACTEHSYSCICTDKGNNNTAIAEYALKGKKESASFECKQKGLQYSGPQYKDVQCALDEK